jgi:hypothetical protein
MHNATNESDGPVAHIQLAERICSGTRATWAVASTLL